MIRLSQATSQCPPAALIVTVAAIAFLLYAPSWSHPFVYDDVTAVRDHPLVRGQSPWYEIFTSPYWPADVSPDPLYRPATIATFRLNHWLFGGHPIGFHLTNSALHAAVSVLVALLAVRLWRRTAAGWIAGLVFAAHPLHAEAVVPIVGRSELLAALFITWIAHAHLGRVRSGQPATIAHHIKLTILYALACTSKEHGVFAILLVVAIDQRPRVAARGSPGVGDGQSSIDNRQSSIDKDGAYPRTLFKSHYLGLLAVLSAFFVMRWHLFGMHTTLPVSMVDTLLNPLADAAALTRWATPFALCALAVQLICLPVNLCPIWGLGGFDPPASFARPDALIGVAIVLATVAVFIATLLRGNRLLIPIAGWIAFMLLPCHFLPGANWLFAERWLYTPVAMVVLACSGISVIAPRVLGATGNLLRGGGSPARVHWRTSRQWHPRCAVAAAVVLSLPLATLAWRYQHCWRSDIALMTSILERQPDSGVALAGMCAIHDRDGDIEAASEFIARLVISHPDVARTWYYQTKLLIARQRNAEARSALERFIQLAGAKALTRDVRALRARIEDGRH